MTIGALVVLKEIRRRIPDNIALVTFDAGGYVDLLRRLREPDGETVWAPRFDRDLEDAIAASLPVHDDVLLIVTEGN